MGNSGSGGQAASGGGDWSALANLGSQMASHEEETGGNTNFSKFTDMYGSTCSTPFTLCSNCPQGHPSATQRLTKAFTVAHLVSAHNLLVCRLTGGGTDDPKAKNADPSIVSYTLHYRTLP